MFKINVTGEIAEVYTPYNRDFVCRIKNIGSAHWDSKQKCWSIPVDAVDSCREIMREVYGRCDLEEGMKNIKLKLSFSEAVSKTREDVILFGKTLCHAYGRDSGGRPGDGVSYIKGSPQSGGSVKNWRSIVPSDSVVILSDVPETLFQRFNPDLVPGLTVEKVVEESNREVLLAERERLLKRIKEIDEIIAM